MWCLWNHIYKACFVLPVIFINNKNQKIIDFSLELEEIVPLANWSVKSNLDKRWKRCVLYTIASLDYQQSNSSLVSIPADALKKKKGRDSQNCRPSIGSINPKIFFLGGDRGTGLRSPPSGVYLWDRTSPRLAVLEAVHGGRGVWLIARVESNTREGGWLAQITHVRLPPCHVYRKIPRKKKEVAVGRLRRWNGFSSPLSRKCVEDERRCLENADNTRKLLEDEEDSNFSKI